MKRNNLYMQFRYVILLALCALGMASCGDETLVSYTAEDGKPVTIGMRLTVPERDSLSISTRAVDLTSQVSDFYLFIFDAGTKQLVNKYYFANGETKSDATYSSNANAVISREESGDAGALTNITTTTGEKLMMGVANVNIKVGEAILDALNDVATVTELKETLAKEPTVDPSTFTMSGYYSSDASLSTDGKVNITADATLSGHIHLVRVDASITFDVATSDDSKGTFTLQSWQVVNAPKEVHLFATGTEDSSAKYYSSIEKFDFSGEGGFNFYVQERCAEKQNEANTYGARAAWSSQNTGGVKTFTNAPSNATYVLLKGHFSGQSYVMDENGKQSSGPVDVDADVRYYILLGENSHNDYNSYITNRNTQYTYKVRVKGVNEITVEVRKKEENRPDAEGDVIILDGGEPVSFDSHYGAKVLSFTKEQVAAAISKKSLGYAVNTTPYGSIVYRQGETETDEQKRFSDWATFVRVTHEEGGKRYPLHYTTARKENRTIMSVKGLLDDLVTVNNDLAYEGGKVYYTVYVNENYYDKNPRTGGRTSWKEFVNTDDRKLLILANTEFSNDGQSSVTSAAYVIRQKAILTIYNKDASGLDRAWGLEAEEEDLTEGSKTRPKSTNVTPGTDSKYGRHNTLEVVYAPNDADAWENRINKKGYLANKALNDMVYNCMQRNRDLNGDGKITADEVRWYVPALSQYQQMYIGLYGINDPDARLYFNEAKKENKWVYKHYISSYKSQILWAEEGLSNGSKGDSFDSKFYVRCVRDLGVDVSETEKEKISWNQSSQYQDIYTIPADNTIELTYLNEASVRTALENQEVKGDCTTFNEKNKPVIRFQYNEYLTKKTKFMDQNSKAEKGQRTICGETFGNDWRIPTLIEVNIMMQAKDINTIKGDAENLLTRTKFEFWDWNGLKENDRIPDTGTDGRSVLKREWWVGDKPKDRKQDGYRYFGRYAHIYSSLFMLGNGDYGWHSKNQSNYWDARNVEGKIRCVRDRGK